MTLFISYPLSCILYLLAPLIILSLAIIKYDYRWVLVSIFIFILILLINNYKGCYIKELTIYQLVIFYTFALVSVQCYFILKQKKLLNHNAVALTEVQLIQKNWAKEVLKIQEGERERISRDLHDDVGATISALSLHISNFKFEEDDKAQYRQRSLFLINKVANDIRSIAHDLLPRDFSKSDLFSILENTIADLNSAGNISFQFIKEEDESELDSSTTAMMILRIVNELITNVNKHAQATVASVQLAIWKNKIQIMVEDNGVGINTNGPHGIGLQNVTSRVNYLNGKLNIDSNYKGTTIVIVIPNNIVST